MPNPISDLILVALGKAGMNQTELAEKTNYSRTLLSQIICGRKRLTMKAAYKIQEVLPGFKAKKAMRLLIDEFEKDLKNHEPKTN
ncbi:helix-turn-helix domain-containing protein [Pedobacter sp.]|uniref:helix-turn-helix domain-containing protein n=1 Tax=Pedobacter sp. TaxID=1411316 RepID=UPI003C3E7CC6